MIWARYRYTMARPLAIVYLLSWSMKPLGSWKVEHRSNFELKHFIAVVVMSTFETIGLVTRPDFISIVNRVNDTRLYLSRQWMSIFIFGDLNDEVISKCKIAFRLQYEPNIKHRRRLQRWLEGCRRYLPFARWHHRFQSDYVHTSRYLHRERQCGSQAWKKRLRDILNNTGAKFEK